MRRPGEIRWAGAVSWAPAGIRIQTEEYLSSAALILSCGNTCPSGRPSAGGDVMGCCPSLRGVSKRGARLVWQGFGERPPNLTSEGGQAGIIVNSYFCKH